MARMLAIEQDLINAISVPLFFLDLQGNYIGSNKAFSEFLGRSDQEIQSSGIYALLSSTNGYDHGTIDRLLIEKGDVAPYEDEAVGAGGIHRLAEAGQWSRFTAFLELSLPGLRKAELMVDLWKLALQYAPKAPDEVKIRKWIRTLAPGESVTLLADDPAAEEDVRLWCRGHRQEFLGATPAPEGFTRIRVRRSG